MKKATGIVVILLMTLSLQVKAQPSVNADSSKSISTKLDEFLLSMFREYQFNGSVLIAQKGTILLQKGYGWKNVARNILNDTSCIYQIGSITKPFTAEVILKLQELGKLSVKDKLRKYLPGYPNGKKITIENLLTHTSGISSYDVDEKDTIAWNPVSKPDMINYFKTKPLEFKPGTTYKYSNSGYFLLGMIIEKITGKPYEQVVRELIFEPLQMTHSGFDFIHLQDTAKATGYSVLNKSGQVPAHLVDSTVSYAAGAIFSTIGDLYKWAKDISGNKIISAQTWKKAFVPFRSNYGYGWFIDSLNGKSYIGHSGGITGFSSYLVYFPEEDVTIIILSNLLKENDQAPLPVQDLSAIIFNKPYSLFTKKKEITVDDSLTDQYVGTYSLAVSPKRIMVITKSNGHLRATLPDKTTLQFTFLTGTKFQFKNLPNVEGEFIITNGTVIKMIISQNGLFDWIKIK